MRCLLPALLPCVLSFLIASPLLATTSLHTPPQSCEIFAETNGILTLETESAVISDDWSLHNDVDGALGTGYYEWKHGNASGSIDKAGSGILTYTFQIDTPGTYRFILRSAAPHNTEHNDVWARFTQNEVVGIKSNGSSEVDLGQNTWFKVYQNKGGDEWNWAANTVDHNAHHIFALIDSPGQYVMQLSGRSTQFKIDRIVLFHDSVNLGPATDLANPESGCYDGESSLRPPETPPSTETGLQYAYYEGSWETMPDFSMLDPIKTGVQANIALSPRNRDNDFGFLFTGYINVPSDGLYAFYTSSDDGSQFFIGDQLVVNNDGIHSDTEASGIIGLQTGLHPFTLLFFENSGDETLTVSWTPPGESKTQIGNEVFVHDPDNLLPVELTAFDGRLDEDTVILTWQTASELNNAGFTVERSTDLDQGYQEIGSVEGAGTTALIQNYSFRDNQLPQNTRTLYYRIKQIDFDGTFYYSPTVTIQRSSPSGTQLHVNYPNPFNPATQLSFTLSRTGMIRLAVYDISGRLVETLIQEERSAGFYEIMFNAPISLTSGLYIYRLETPTEVLNGTMMLLK